VSQPLRGGGHGPSDCPTGGHRRLGGVLEIPGEGPPPETVSAAERFDVDLAGHLSVPLSKVKLADADLVLGFERRHVAEAVIGGGAAPDRTFNLIELASLLREGVAPVDATTDPFERARDLIAAAHLRRVQTAGFVAGEEVLDPIGLPLHAHVGMAEQVQEICKLIAEKLFGPHHGRLT
jgi:protein-tyrosine-phosphatase